MQDVSSDVMKMVMSSTDHWSNDSIDYMSRGQKKMYCIIVRVKCKCTLNMYYYIRASLAHLRSKQQ